MPRPEAQAIVKALCTEDAPLQEAATARFPDLDLADIFDPAASLGTAPDEARAFAEKAAEVARESAGTS